ncbi:MAG: basic amino acid ABC transporter substrate-binding protein [Defluviitaleaceae bacterium]|nr:basic amino acid ABC transporter substrate-binding protein [Defluviitaleaceae bacterium]
MKKTVMAILGLVTALVVLAACGNNNNDRPELHMATSADFPPFEFITPAGEFDGFDIHMARAIAEILDMELVIHDMEFVSAIASTQTGNTDITIAALSITDDRRQQVNFSIPYFETTLVIIVQQDSEIQTVADLDVEGNAIAVQMGTTSDMMATWYLDNVDVQRFVNAPMTVMELNANRVDAIVIDAGVASQFIDDNPNLRILSNPLGVEQYAIAVYMGNPELLEQIDDALQQLMDNGELDRIYNMFFGGDE